MPVVVATQTMKHCLSVYTDPKNNIVFISDERKFQRTYFISLKVFERNFGLLMTYPVFMTRNHKYFHS